MGIRADTWRGKGWACPQPATTAVIPHVNARAGLLEALVPTDRVVQDCTALPRRGHSIEAEGEFLAFFLLVELLSKKIPEDSSPFFTTQ